MENKICESCGMEMKEEKLVCESCAANISGGLCYCESCAMPMKSEALMGTNKDGSVNREYCTYCYQKGSFTDPDMTMEQMIEICVPHMKAQGIEERAAREQLNAVLPNLKRWKK